MNVLRIAGQALGWFFGIGGGSSSSPAGSIAGAVADTVKAGDEADTAQTQAQASEQASARAFAAPGVHGSPLDVLVDAMNRLPRPLITLWLFGGFAGLWPLPDLSHVDPRVLYAAQTVLAFWFGGRLLTKDVPAAVTAILRALGKRG